MPKVGNGVQFEVLEPPTYYLPVYECANKHVGGVKRATNSSRIQ
jgi:hypothetical protein